MCLINANWGFIGCFCICCPCRECALRFVKGSGAVVGWWLYHTSQKTIWQRGIWWCSRVEISVIERTEVSDICHTSALAFRPPDNKQWIGGWCPMEEGWGFPCSPSPLILCSLEFLKESWHVTMAEWVLPSYTKH